MGSTYERRMSMEEQRYFQQRSSSALYQGPVMIVPLIWYRW